MEAEYEKNMTHVRAFFSWASPAGEKVIRSMAVMIILNPNLYIRKQANLSWAYSGNKSNSFFDKLVVATRFPDYQFRENKT